MIYDTMSVLQFDDMGHLDLVVPGSLIHHRRGKFRCELRIAPALGIDRTNESLGFWRCKNGNWKIPN
jgi:hypothetical protein